MIEIEQKLDIIQIEDIDGMFHIFNQFGTPIIYHSGSLWTAPLPKYIYKRILSGERDDIRYAAALDYIRSSFMSVSITRNRLPMQKIPSVTLILTHDCNLDCPYCFDRFSDGGHLEYMTAVQELSSFAKQHRTFRVVFFGGEPLLEFPLLKRIVGFCEELRSERAVDGISYCLTTNGTILSEAMVRFFNTYAFNVTLSVDGVFSNSLNRIIGCPPKILCTDSIMLYRRLEKLYIRVTVYPHMVNHMQDIYAELQNLEPSAIAFSPIIDKKFAFSRADAVNWKRQLDSIIYHRTLHSFGCRVNMIDSLVNSVVQGFPVQHGCGVDDDSIAIDVDGTQYPCHRFVKRIKAGSVRIGFPDNPENNCPDCWANNICRGGCGYCHTFVEKSMLSFLCDNSKKEAELACWLALLKKRT